MHGLLLVDKPAGMTSHDVVQAVRRIYRTRKVGHAGTLDPLATGVLPVAVGDGTKILQFLLSEDKGYRATFRLGVTTDTLDSQGQVLLERPVPEFTLDDLKSICAGFCGEIEQLPPMFSALKQDGVPLYKLARQGKTVERKTRRVTIHRLDVISADSQTATIEVDCSKGTYIRSLINDIGECIGCGAHMTALRRLRSGRFNLAESLPLDTVQAMEDPAAVLLTLDKALYAYPAVQLDGQASETLKHGIPPSQEHVIMENGVADGTLVRLQINHELAAMARYAPQRSKETRGDFELLRVFVSY